MLPESEIPTALVQHRVRHAEPAAAGPASGHGRAGRPGRPRAALPDGADPPGGERPTPRSRYPTRCSTSTGSGGRRRSTARERLERAIGTRSRIFYKYEGVSPAGSHKPNTAVAQAYYNKAEGRTRLSTETGAGQWGSALAFACKLVGLECKVYMVRVSYEQKPFRRSLMHVWGAEVVASPSDETESGRKVLAEHPDSPGSLGIAISEAVEDAARPRRHRVLARQRPQPRPAAPDGDRPGGDRADGARGRVPGRRHRLRRRRLELRRARVPVPAREDRRPGDRRPRLRAGRLPDAHARAVRLRLRRHGQADAARPDAHARPRLRAGADPRGRPPLPRRRAAHLAARAATG